MKGIGRIIYLLLTIRIAGAQDLTVITQVNVINRKGSGVLRNKSVSESIGRYPEYPDHSRGAERWNMV